MRCPSCGAESAPGSRFCASCGVPFALAAPGDVTVLSGSGPDETRLSGAPPAPRAGVTASGSGWLSSTPDIDHGRFPPGTIVADRYRIVGLLGRGGMGEVFRADDLRLGQPVALKFLPPLLERDTTRLAQFHNEVRTARQVSHRNVCRVYDIGEVDGQHFLTMEYVDGEDLSSLLRRIGRLPEDKAIEIARQICAGLHAAHERGLLHRDLKPANIMLDREGRVRITDFSLAAVAGTVEDIRAGTPAYMAPEQLAGREVTARSDIYALGLVLYELFTGKRALEAATIADLISRQASGEITMPTDLVTSLDPVIERAIMRCLQPDPAKRPASAIAVAASLPGGDPLAAALAAGETPSPEMVAAAGSESAALSPLAGAGWLAAVVAMLLVVAGAGGRFELLSRVPLNLSADVLEDRARTLERALGVSASAVDRIHGFGAPSETLRWLGQGGAGAAGYDRLREGEPAALVYWYRSSPRLLFSGNQIGYPGFADPPITLSGMVNMVLSSEGRLQEFHLVPAQVESLADPAPAPIDWQVFFDAAGLDRSRFTEVAPDWTPRSYADARQAWTGSFVSMPDVPIRVDVASHRGWPVYFQISGPWARPSRMQAAATDRSVQISAMIVNVIIVPVLIGGAALLARRNVRRGRGDRRGASRVAGFVFGVQMLSWLLRAHHLPDPGLSLSQFFGASAQALFQAGLFWIFYLAVEPQVRRVWPHILITWSRLVGGSLRDPLVGRDLVAGTAAGLLLTVLTLAHRAIPLATGGAEFPPEVTNLETLLGVRRLAASLLMQLANAIQNGMLGVLGLALLRMLLRRTSAAFVAGVLIFGFMAARGQFESGVFLLDYGFGVLLCVVLLSCVLRYGLFATVVAFFAHFATLNIAMTLDASKLYFPQGLAVMALLAIVGVAGVYLARAGEPLFGKVLAED
jgi:hypothetical protein